MAVAVSDDELPMSPEVFAEEIRRMDASLRRIERTMDFTTPLALLANAGIAVWGLTNDAWWLLFSNGFVALWMGLWWRHGKTVRDRIKRNWDPPFGTLDY